jgi:outer membrane lipoprotein-sorting protein
MTNAMPRVLKAALVLLVAVLVSAPGPIFRPAEFTGPDLADLIRVSAYLNSIHSMRGSFLQIDPNGTSEQGNFYIVKPGKMRFEYQPPNPTLVVSDGKTVAVFNKQLNTVDTYPLYATPLNLLLSENVKLQNNQSVMGVTRQTGALIVYAKSGSTKEGSGGNIIITFADSPLELRQWTIEDAQGLSTTVSLRDVQTGGADLPDKFFSLTATKKE